MIRRWGPTDRGSMRGAKRCIVNERLELLDHETAKAAGITGTFFQSKHEAKHYIALETIRRAGKLRQIDGLGAWRQVRFPLYAIRPDGLKEVVCKLVLDFAYSWLDGDVWRDRYEDVKPSGGHREDTYLLKKKWFETQYGIKILEV